MKNSILLTILVFTAVVIVKSQTVFHIPDNGVSIVDITVPKDEWNVTNEDGLFSIVPNDTGETARLVTMIWASEDPTSESALDDIAIEAFDAVESVLKDITWEEDVTDFENNGITYVANDGYGYYVNEDGSRDYMSTTIMLLMPDETNVLALVFFCTADAYDKWEESLLNVILSMKPSE